MIIRYKPGVFLGEHGFFDKRMMYEEALRMPFVVRYPQEIPAGRRTAMYYRYWLHQQQRPAYLGIRTQRYKLINDYGDPLGKPGAYPAAHPDPPGNFTTSKTIRRNCVMPTTTQRIRRRSGH